jgi:hypothetical protein
MAAVNQIHMQQFQNMQMRMSLNMAMNASMRRNANILNNPKQTYKAVFPDGTYKIFRSKIMFDDQNKSYLVYEDKNYKKGDSLRIQKIHPAMTKYISKLGEEKEELIKGLPADSCWMFKSISGKVNAYSFLPETFEVHLGYLKWLQKEDGPFEKVDEVTMRKLFNNDTEALTLVDKKKYFEALKRYNKNSKKQVGK